MIGLAKKKKRKFWDGRTDHTFFGLLTDRIGSLGFSWGGAAIDAEVGVANWTRPLFDGYALELSLMAEHPKFLEEDQFGFDPTLFVVSTRQADVWNSLRLYECLNLVLGSEVKPDSGPAPILVINLRWLVGTWESIKGNASLMPAWHRVASGDAAACADDLSARLGRHLPRLLEFLSTPHALAELMLSLEKFPGNDDGNGPRSASRSVYTAILLHDLGRTEDACKELDLEERQVAAAVQRGMESEFLEVVRCQKGRLTQWMNEA